jgi:hydroxypyruvate reductase
MPFEPSVLTPNPTDREPILRILEAALAAVDPFQAVQAHLQFDGRQLQIGDRRYTLDDYRRILVVGAGKASTPMSQAIEAMLGKRMGQGLVVVKDGHAGPTRWISVVEASHPVPDERGVEAGRRILQLAQEATAEDLVIALISGGGSALLVAPAEGLSLEDLQALNRALLACGASIDEINCLRKHCSAVKGGQLARAVYPATLITLVLSDVVGSPLDVIASGPTVPDRTTWADAWSIIQRYGLEKKLPEAIIARLRAGLQGVIPDTPKPGDPIFHKAQTIIVADNRVAALAAKEEATRLGYNTLLLSTFIEGEAREVGKVLAALGKEVQASGNPLPTPACLILGGETTVTLNESPGKGGRNQELALAAALALSGATGIHVASLATDGTDGPTDGAGGLVDGTTLSRGQALGLNAETHLLGHDAYSYLEAVYDLLLTGPTQTNVNDLMLVVVRGG